MLLSLRKNGQTSLFKEVWVFKVLDAQTAKLAISAYAGSGAASEPPYLVNFSLLICEDFWVFFSFLSDRSVFIPYDKCVENTAIAGKRE